MLHVFQEICNWNINGSMWLGNTLQNRRRVISFKKPKLHFRNSYTGQGICEFKIWPRFYLFQSCAAYHLVSTIQWRHHDAMASQITGVSLVCSTVCSGADQKKLQSSAPLARIYPWPVDSLMDSPYKGPVAGKVFPFDNVIMPFDHHITRPESIAPFIVV